MMALIDFGLELVAVFVGVVLAFEFDNFRESRDENKERLRLLGLLYREVTANVGILDGMRERTTVDFGVPNTRPMRNVWDGITSKLAILKNDDLLEEATMLYWQLANLDRMLDLYRVYAGAYQYLSSEERMRMESTLSDQRAHYVGYIEKEALPKISIVMKLIESELRLEHARVPQRKANDQKTGVP